MGAKVTVAEPGIPTEAQALIFDLTRVPPLEGTWRLAHLDDGGTIMVLRDAHGAEIGYMHPDDHAAIMAEERGSP